MTILSYEPFIRICQRCLINIDGTVPHSSNQACPLLSFFLHLLLAHHHYLSSHHVHISSIILVGLYHPCSLIITHILTCSTDTPPIKSKRCLSSSLPSFFLTPPTPASSPLTPPPFGIPIYFSPSPSIVSPLSHILSPAFFLSSPARSPSFLALPFYADNCLCTLWTPCC